MNPNETIDNLYPFFDDPLLTVEEAADYLKVSVSSVHAMRREKGLAYVKVTADVRFRRSDLNRFISQHIVSSK